MQKSLQSETHLALKRSLPQEKGKKYTLVHKGNSLSFQTFPLTYAKVCGLANN